MLTRNNLEIFEFFFYHSRPNLSNNKSNQPGYCILPSNFLSPHLRIQDDQNSQTNLHEELCIIYPSQSL